MFPLFFSLTGRRGPISCRWQRHVNTWQHGSSTNMGGKFSFSDSYAFCPQQSPPCYHYFTFQTVSYLQSYLELCKYGNIPVLCFSLRYELHKSKHFVLLMKEISHIRRNVFFRPCYAYWVLTCLFLPLGHGRTGGCWSGKSCWDFQLQPWADRKNLEQARTEIQTCKQPGKISDPQVNVPGLIGFVWSFFPPPSMITKIIL